MNRRSKTLTTDDTSIRLWPGILWIALVALAYFLVARFSLFLLFKPEGIAAIWPPSGIFLSAILLTRRKIRPHLVMVLFLTDLAAEMLAGIPPVMSLVYSTALAGDALLSSWLLLRFIGEPVSFRNVRQVTGFLLLALLLSNALSAVVTALVSSLFLGTPFWSSWFWWWSSDGVGNLLITPVIMNAAFEIRTRFADLKIRRTIEGIIVLLGMLFLNIYAFSHFSGEHWQILMVNLITFPFLIWASMRLGVTGAVTASLLLAVVMIGNAVTGRFSLSETSSSLITVILIQVYLAILSVTALYLAATITERKQAQEDIQRLSRFPVEDPNPVLRISRNGCILYANPASVPILTAWEREVGQELPDDWRKRIESLSEPGKTMEVELDYRGRLFLYSMTSVANQDYVNIYGRDITEKKQAEDALNAYSEKLEQRVDERTRELRQAQDKLVRQEKLATLGQLAGSVSHELRNPLGVISNAVYLLTVSQPEADAQVKKYLDIIDKETKTADKIINDLLDFTRINSAEREPVAVAELAADVRKRYPAPEGVELTLKFPKDLPRLLADPHHMAQVLGNLVLNAYQAMPQGGKMIISAAQKEAQIAIAVKDSGVGITPEYIDKLFEPLFTTKARGIGLGLAICKNLVEANGGRIEVQSKPGRGSTFTVYLPMDGQNND